MNATEGIQSMTGLDASPGRFFATVAVLVIVSSYAEAEEAGTEAADGLKLAAHELLQARQSYRIVQHRQGEVDRGC